MHVGMIGLGRMGLGLGQRLVRAGFQVTGYDPSLVAAGVASDAGLEIASSLEALARKATPARLWVMVPSGATTEAVLDELATLLGNGDSIVEGGNSNFRDSMSRAETLRTKGVGMLDVGTSGGIRGLEHGFSLMIGGDSALVDSWSPVFRALAPSPGVGWAHVGPSGAGHFAKMVHNGVEYGMMQAMAEGVAIMQAEGSPAVDATAAVRAWREGSIVSSTLLDLLAGILEENPRLEGIGSAVADSGEGRWAIQAAIERDVSAPVLTLALLERLRSRDQDRTADRALAALRGAFGGHDVPGEDR